MFVDVRHVYFLASKLYLAIGSITFVVVAVVKPEIDQSDGVPRVERTELNSDYCIIPL